MHSPTGCAQSNIFLTPITDVFEEDEICDAILRDCAQLSDQSCTSPAKKRVSSAQCSGTDAQYFAKLQWTDAVKCVGDLVDKDWNNLNEDSKQYAAGVSGRGRSETRCIKIGF